MLASDMVGEAAATAAVLPFADGEFRVEFNEYTLKVCSVLFRILAVASHWNKATKKGKTYFYRNDNEMKINLFHYFVFDLQIDQMIISLGI